MMNFREIMTDLMTIASDNKCNRRDRSKVEKVFIYSIHLEMGPALSQSEHTSDPH